MDERLGAVAHVRDRITKRARDPRLAIVPGLADDLRAIGEAFASLETSAKLLARLQLSARYNYSLSGPEYQYVATLAGEVAPGYYLDELGI